MRDQIRCGTDAIMPNNSLKEKIEVTVFIQQLKSQISRPILIKKQTVDWVFTTIKGIDEKKTN